MTPRTALHLSLATWLLMALAISASGQYCPPGQPCYPQQPQYQQQPQMQWSDSGSDVLVRGNDGSLGSGTVVANVNGTSYVLTNHHVVRDGQSFEIVNQTGRLAAQLIEVDQQNDLAILRTGFSLPAVEVGTQVPQAIVIRSYDHGRQFRRRVASIVGSAGNGSMRCQAVIYSGSSGGGVYDEQGRLVGVVWGCRPQDRETYFTPIGPIRTLLTRIGLIGAVQVQPPQQPTQQPQHPQATDPGPEREQVQLPPCACDEKWDAMAAQWKAQSEVNKQLSASITNIDARIAMLENTQAIAGERGPQGPQGPPGPAGNDADVGPLTDRIAALEAELASLKASKFKVITHTPQGVFDSEEIPLGGDIHLQYVEARKGDAPK